MTTINDTTMQGNISRRSFVKGASALAAGGALAGAFASGARTLLAGLVSVHALYAAASEIAAERARGTGTFQMEFLDALDNFRDEDFARVTIIAQ